MRFLLVLFAAALLSGCVTRPKVYKAPDPAKVIATSKRLSAAIDRENETISRADAKVQRAQQSSDRVAAQSASVLNLIRELKRVLPGDPAAAGRIVEALESAQNEELQDTGVLSLNVIDVRGEVAQLKADHAAVVKERDRLVNVDQPKLFADGQKLANEATKKDHERYDAQQQLVQQKSLKWLWRIGGGAIVLGIIALFVTGKISIAAIRAYLHI